MRDTFWTWPGYKTFDQFGISDSAVWCKRDIGQRTVHGCIGSDMRLRIKQARPSSLNDAVCHAVELKALNRVERKHLQGRNYTRSTSDDKACVGYPTNNVFEMLQKTVRDLSRAFDSFIGNGNQPRVHNKPTIKDKPYTWKCYECGSETTSSQTVPN